MIFIFYFVVLTYEGKNPMSIKTLLVDDEKSLLEQAEIFLENQDQEIEVLTAPSAGEALGMLDEEDFDVIVSDYQMPRMNGLELLKEIRKGRNSDIPFIVFTGKGREEVAIKALNLGADRYLQKGGDPKSQYGVLAKSINQEYKHWKSKRKWKESEKEKSIILESTSDKIAYHDLDHNITWANKSYLEAVEKNLEEIKEGKCYNIWYGKDEPCEGCPIDRALTSGETEKGEISPSEDDKYWLMTGTPVRNEEGNIKGVLGSSLDITETKKVEKELEEKNRFLQNFLNNIPGTAFRCLKDEYYTMKFLSEGFEELTGYEKEDIIDNQRVSFKDLIIEEDKQKIREKIEDISKGDSYKVTYRMEDSDDEINWVWEQGKVVESDEESQYLEGIILDITERKEAEERIREDHEKLEKLHEKVGDLGKCESEKEICDVVIEASEHILEFEVCGIDFVEEGEFVPISLSTEIDDGFIRRDVEEAGISKKVYRDKESLLIKDRREIDYSKPVVSDYRSSITIPMGDFGIYQALSTKVSTFEEQDMELAEILVNHATEAINRLRSEDKLKRSKQKIERLHQASAEIEVCQTEEEVYECAVKAAEDILDFDMCGFDAVEGDKFVVKATSSDIPKEGYIDKPIEEGGTSKRTYLNQESYLINDLRNDENAKPVKSDYRSIISLPVDEYGIFQAVSTETDHFDENDLKEAELLISHVTEALKRLETEEREEFLHSLLRHDVGNKNQLIKGYLEMMKDYDLSDELRRFLEKAEGVLEDSSEIIGKVRKLRKIEEEEEISESSLNLVMEKVLSRYEDQLQEKGIDIKVDEDDCKVKGGTLMEELFSNLIENSIQHSDCDKIKICIKTEKNECIVTVEDDGDGVPDKLKDKIFEKGFKSGKNAGTGLGLYMVKEIARSYDGTVEVKDSEMGGVRFDVSLEKVDT